jgi:hypothetical protein
MSTLSAGSVGLSLAEHSAGQVAAGRASDMSCILLFLVGGPSHLDTFDLKPGAPDNVRGPFRPIQTTIPGMQVCEHLPLMAQMAKHFAIVRSVYHRSAPIHETGHQLMQTGHLFGLDQEHPHYGAVISHLRGQRKDGLPAFMVVPSPIGYTGVSISHGQGAGYLGVKHEPYHINDWASAGGRNRIQEAAFVRPFSPAAQRGIDIAAEPEDLKNRYGRNTFGQSCLLARRLVEHGVRLITVNMFDTVFNKITWDCHADGGILKTSLDDYRRVLCPVFDKAYTALLEDLSQRGMLESTLVVAMGEFGRTPRLNAYGGRDHWPGVWSILFAGGRVRGGQVIGASDRIGAEPYDRPVSPAEVAATIYQGLGIDLDACLPGPNNQPLSITTAQPIHELFSG